VRTIIFVLGLCLVTAPAVSAENQGESTYKAICIKCHGPNGDGKGHAGLKITPADLCSDEVQNKTDEELYESIAFGVGHKQYARAFANRGLSRKKIADVVTYIRRFAKKSEKDR
jgi:mono/diheme cytochrome c family protein